MNDLLKVFCPQTYGQTSAGQTNKRQTGALMGFIKEIDYKHGKWYKK